MQHSITRQGLFATDASSGRRVRNTIMSLYPVNAFTLVHTYTLGQERTPGEHLTAGTRPANNTPPHRHPRRDVPIRVCYID